MKKELKSQSIKMSLAALCLSILSACGGENSQQIPGTAVLSASPQEVTWNIGPPDPDVGCILNEDSYQDHAFVVTLTDDQAAIGNIDLRVFATLSDNTFSGVSVIDVYDDVNSNGVIDSSDTLVSGVDQPLYVTRLNQQGYKMLLARVNLSCPYKGHIDLFAAGAFALVSIEVTQE